MQLLCFYHIQALTRWVEFVKLDGLSGESKNADIPTWRSPESLPPLQNFNFFNTVPDNPFASQNTQSIKADLEAIRIML
jgi:hypothetical protein